MTLNEKSGVLWRETGFRLELCEGSVRNADNINDPFRTLYVNDLNPQACIVHGLTRWEAIRVGFWFFRKAINPNPWRKSQPE